MHRATSLIVLVLTACEEIGPPPPQPIKPPAGYVPATAAAAPEPKLPVKADALEPGAPAPAPAPKCPADVTTLLVTRTKSLKARNRQLELRITAAAKEPKVGFHQPHVDDAVLDDVRLASAELVAVLTVTRGKPMLSVAVTCGEEDRQLEATVDPKNLAVQLKQVPRPPEPGYLTLVAAPGLKVTSAGKLLGTTPLKNLPLSPGTYPLSLKPSKGKTRTAVAEIRSGETSTVTLRK